MDIKKLKLLLNKEEGTKLDFKLKLDLNIESGRKEFAKDVSAIANSKKGRGYILIGIEDKTKKIIGINDNEIEEEQLQQIVLSRIDPPVPISYEVCEIENVKIGIVTIFTGENAPYQMRENGIFYIRRGSTTDYMRKFELVSFFEEGNILDVEKTPVLNSYIEMLNQEMLKEYFLKQRILFTEENKLFLLNTSGIITRIHADNKYYLTLGGALVFGDYNRLLFPYNCIKISHNDDTFRVYGNLIGMFKEVNSILKDIIKIKYPLEAILNSLENAILYRDYGMYNKEISIVLSNRNIIIESPGLLIKDDSHTKGYYFNKNLWIYEKFKTLMGDESIYKEFHGFIRIKNAFKYNVKVKFVNDNTNKVFKVILPGLKYVY